MFGQLTEKFHSIFSTLFSQKTLTSDNIQDAVNEVRLALLEADVQYSVVKTFIKKVKEKAEGEDLLKNVKPGEQFAKIVHDELVLLMGGDEEGLHFKKKPAIIMLSGLQGSGKTTSAVKLARYLKKKGSYIKPCVVACDLQRPAAVEQLKVLAGQAEIDCYSIPGSSSPIEVAQAAINEAKEKSWDLLIFDTAGRLHIDTALMDELVAIKKIIAPEEVLFVANAATGQDAVKSATAFNEKVAITGTILTMLDGTSRGGAAISIREVTGKPLKFEGVGERLDDFQLFNPTSMADRILGMGDTINLVRKAQEHIVEEDAAKLEEKMRKATFNFDDYLTHTRTLKKMGSMKGLLGMLPGMSKLKEMDFDENELFKLEAIIHSMTPKERAEKIELTMSRRKRIARGSGRTLDEVNKMLKSFKQTKEFFKNVPNMKQLQKMIGGFLWR
ncbi:MAG: ffh [Chlamydiia bacterium]|nr:ffh [Chlamydiia bacterium]